MKGDHVEDFILLKLAEKIQAETGEHIFMWGGGATLCGWDRSCLRDSYVRDFQENLLGDEFTNSDYEYSTDGWHQYLTDHGDIVGHILEDYEINSHDLDETCDECGRSARSNLALFVRNRLPG